jgi:hypothetical protein
MRTNIKALSHNIDYLQDKKDSCHASKLPGEMAFSTGGKYVHPPKTYTTSHPALPSPPKNVHHFTPCIGYIEQNGQMCRTCTKVAVELNQSSLGGVR